MNAIILTAYILAWPVLSLGILALLIVSLVRDIRHSRKTGEEML